MNLQWTVEKVVMQPTTFCNIDCAYCYLANRDKALRMLPSVSDAVASWLPLHDRSVEMIWHGGEPMATGIRYFRQLLEPFEEMRRAGRVSHFIQTNATLITPEWCELFLEFEVKVGVSLDGPSWMNKRRVDWKGKETFEKVFKGITFLKDANIPFQSICVVSKEGLECPEELYRFFRALGCTSLGINIEEKLGPNETYASDDASLVTSFWEQLFLLWEIDRSFEIREFWDVLNWMEEVCKNNLRINTYDLFPSVGWNGDVVVLAPEFLNVSTERYGTFTVGNVLKTSFKDILDRSISANYMKEYTDGVTLCKSSCEYFDFCKGGVGSNKYFELGLTGGTETVHCRNREQRLIDGVLRVL